MVLKYNMQIQAQRNNSQMSMSIHDSTAAKCGYKVTHCVQALDSLTQELQTLST